MKALVIFAADDTVTSPQPTMVVCPWENQSPADVLDQYAKQYKCPRNNMSYLILPTYDFPETTEDRVNAKIQEVREALWADAEALRNR